MDVGCLACELIAGRRPLPGGRLFATAHWVVEHCIGPLGIGTLLVKPLRHCVAVSQLTEAEASELGSLLHRVSRCVHELNRADQIYVCLWSHAGWEPGHIHFVVQPAWRDQAASFSHPGPTLQSEMLIAATALEPARVEDFCGRAREWFVRSSSRKPAG